MLLISISELVLHARIQLQKISIAFFVLAQQYDLRQAGHAILRFECRKPQTGLHTRYRLNARFRSLRRELDSAEHVVRVGDRDRRHAVLFAKRRDGSDPDRAFEQRVFGVESEVNESWQVLQAI